MGYRPSEMRLQQSEMLRGRASQAGLGVQQPALVNRSTLAHTGGIYVSVADNLGFAPRQQVRVTGQLADSSGLLVLINVTDTKAHGSGPKVQPLPVATGAVGEATEGKLVRITGTITQPVFDDMPFGFIIVINDGSGAVNSVVSASTGIDVSGLRPGQTIELTGFSGQFADHYEVDPARRPTSKSCPDGNGCPSRRRYTSRGGLRLPT